MTLPLVLDLCAGTGSATEPLVSLGFSRVCVDIASQVTKKNRLRTTIVQADVREFEWQGPPVGIVWASPPCTEFSRTLMPWCEFREPSMELVYACLRVIDRVNPAVWCLENVRGAARWIEPLLGKPRQIVSGRWYLWGNFEPLNVYLPRSSHTKERRSSANKRERSRIPQPIAQAFADSAARSLRQLSLPFEGIER